MRARLAIRMRPLRIPNRRAPISPIPLASDFWGERGVLLVVTLCGEP